MLLLDVKTDDVTDYKETSIYIAFPYCTGKCGDECQNRHLRGIYPSLNVTASDIYRLYSNLKTHKAVVMAGLEPLDSFNDVLDIVEEFFSRIKPVDIVIFTGYNYDEYKEQFEEKLIQIVKGAKRPEGKKLIVKIGRYDNVNYPGSWFCKTLGVNLATKNQFTITYLPDGTGYIDKFKEDYENGNKEN